jgi:two-component system, OmpR family, heavy metal sensor histidine kinase CusS
VTRLSIRWRLTLWYGTILSVILAGFSAAVYLLMERHLLMLTDAALNEELDELADEVKRVPSQSNLPAVLKTQFPGHEGYELQVRTEAGEPLFRSVGIESTGLPDPAARRYVADLPVYESLTLRGGRPMRVASREVSVPSGKLVVQAAMTLVPNARALRELVTVFLTLGPVALVCAVGGGYWLARKALSPVDRMAATAAEITASRLDRRLAEPEAFDELGYLARTFNTMISRLQRSFEEVRRFTADAAHELRTPLAIMRTEAEVALRSPRCPDRDARVLENLIEEIERLSRLVSQLLFLCREDTGIGVSTFRPVKLATLVREVVEHMEVLAREKGLNLQARLADAPEISGDADRLRQLFFNLLDNAIKYTPPGGSVVVEAKPAQGQPSVNVIIADTGIGIPAEHLPHVFERFYRVDSSRGSAPDGNGLGLAICYSIAESHAGRLAIESTPGIGTQVSITLPILAGDTKVKATKERLTESGSDELSITRTRDASTPGGVEEPMRRSASVRHPV